MVKRKLEERALFARPVPYPSAEPHGAFPLRVCTIDSAFVVPSLHTVLSGSHFRLTKFTVFHCSGFFALQRLT